MPRGYHKTLAVFALLFLIGSIASSKVITRTYYVADGDASNGNVISSQEGITLTYSPIDDWKTEGTQVTVNGKTFSYCATTTSTNGTNTSTLATKSTNKNYWLLEPDYDGTLTIIIHNAGSTKPGYLYEDGVSIGATLISTNGETATWSGASPLDTTNSFTGGIQFDVKAGSKYTISLAGSKAHWMGFIYKYNDGTTKPSAQSLNRGLMALNLVASGGTGNLVSWRFRKSDDKSTKFKLYRVTGSNQETPLNGGKFILDRTNFLDAAGTTSSYYKLEVYDKFNNLVETQNQVETWSNQTKYITLEGGAPTDPTSAGATYTPNDASFCDMDGDGEYEIVMKWAPSNEKDAASSGTTSPAFYGCYKLDGTRLWILHTGPNMFNSAHTTPFIAWDLDGDGYGEFMVKTGPGAIDGEGNYVIMDGDDPTANWKNSRGKQVEGPEYITVFDGSTGEELSTIPYHTNYAAGKSYWGDSEQNRSERYLAALAYLDGEDKNPSPIFARGYYSGAFVGAYDWDGSELKERWVSKNTTSGKGLWGEGAHWIAVGDCDNDGKQEIVYGSAALDDDGSLLYRTGLGHGDALHLGDFDTEREGLEVFMVHEHSPYGMDLRDAKTGELILHKTASSDTGRGLIGHFDSTAASAYWQFSATPTLYDVDCNTVVDSIIHGGGASLNNRIYWNGDLYDDYYDKSILEYYNPNAKSFSRILVNGGNYTIGTLNNSSKYNPCVLGDILGDWREEIVTWTGDANSGYQLIINATSYTSDYRIPHLMDDAQYRVQVVNQNCAYNQPPHLSFDPAVIYAGNPNVADEELEKDIYTIDFEDEDYSMFTYNSAAGITQAITEDANDTKSYDIYATSSRTVSLDLSAAALQTSKYSLYTFSFDWETGGSNTDGSVLTVNTKDGAILTINISGGSSKTTSIDFINSGETLLTYSQNRSLATPTSLFHIEITGNSEGMFLTVTKDGSTYIDYVQLSKSKSMITGITESIGRSYNHTVFDNISYKVALQTGDVNSDGLVDIADVASMIGIMLGKDSDTYGTADIYKDGVINNSDLKLLIESILNK